MIPGAEFHHIGVACRSFLSEQPRFEALGYRQEGADAFDPIQNVQVRFLVGGGPRVELVCGDGHQGPLAAWLKSGAKMYHLAYVVDRMPEAVAFLSGQGAKLIVPPVPAAAFDGRKIAFVMLPNMLLVELIER